MYQRFGGEVPVHWRLVVDTVDGFQGDERDVILFSLVGGDAMPAGSARFLCSDRNRFNVAVSRARGFLHIFGDRDWARGSGADFLVDLVHMCEKAESQPEEPVRWDLVGPVWEPKCADALREAGLPIQQQYHTCGYYLDFALLREGLKLDIEIDGESVHRDAFGSRRFEDIYRDLVLQAADWKVMRFWVYELRENLDDCIQRVRAVWAG